MTTEQTDSSFEDPTYGPHLPTWMQAVRDLRIISEKADRANLANYDIQLQNGHMTEDLYTNLTTIIYRRRHDWLD